MRCRAEGRRHLLLSKKELQTELPAMIIEQEEVSSSLFFSASASASTPSTLSSLSQELGFPSLQNGGEESSPTSLPPSRSPPLPFFASAPSAGRGRRRQPGPSVFRQTAGAASAASAEEVQLPQV